MQRDGLAYGMSLASTKRNIPDVTQGVSLTRVFRNVSSVIPVMNAPEIDFEILVRIGSDVVTGAVDHRERRDTMRRITHSSRSLIVFATMLATAFAAAALPLAAMANNGGGP